MSKSLKAETKLKNRCYSFKSFSIKIDYVIKIYVHIFLIHKLLRIM
jgi:hypothetical protein